MILLLDVPAVSEDGIDYVLESELDEAVSFAPEGQPYLDAVRAAVRSEGLRRRMRSNGAAVCRLRAQRRSPWPPHSPPPPPAAARRRGLPQSSPAPSAAAP